MHLGARTNQWDTCGPEAILREAGGILTDATGAPMRYDRAEIRNQQGVVASSNVIHDRIIETIAEFRSR